MDANEVTKEQFLSYLRVQRSGVINMTDIVNGARLARISEDCYETILWNYDKLKKKFCSEKMKIVCKKI